MPLPIDKPITDLGQAELIALVLELAETSNRLRPMRKGRKKAGAEAVHAKAERPLVDNPDKVIDVGVETCAQCGAGLRDQAPGAPSGVR